VQDLPASEHEAYDDDPITSEEEEDLLESWIDMKRGNVTVAPGSCTDEEFLRMLGS